MELRDSATRQEPIVVKRLLTALDLHYKRESRQNRLHRTLVRLCCIFGIFQNQGALLSISSNAILIYFHPQDLTVLYLPGVEFLSLLLSLHGLNFLSLKVDHWRANLPFLGCITQKLRHWELVLSQRIHWDFGKIYTTPGARLSQIDSIYCRHEYRPNH